MTSCQAASSSVYNIKLACVAAGHLKRNIEFFIIQNNFHYW